MKELDDAFMQEVFGEAWTPKKENGITPPPNRVVKHLNTFDRGSTIQLFGDPEKYIVTGETEGHMVELKRDNGSTVYIPGMEEAVLVCVKSQK